MHPFSTMFFSVLSANSRSIKSFYDGDNDDDSKGGDSDDDDDNGDGDDGDGNHDDGDGDDGDTVRLCNNG